VDQAPSNQLPVLGHIYCLVMLKKVPIAKFDLCHPGFVGLKGILVVIQVESVVTLVCLRT